MCQNGKLKITNRALNVLRTVENQHNGLSELKTLFFIALHSLKVDPGSPNFGIYF